MTEHPMPHHCKALMFHCIDFRFGKSIERFLEEKNLSGNCDILAAAGAAKNLVSPKEPGDAAFILRQIAISKKLHEIQEVVLMNHTDCGAYGGTSAFRDDVEEAATHCEDLRKAKDWQGRTGCRARCPCYPYASGNRISVGDLPSM